MASPVALTLPLEFAPELDAPVVEQVVKPRASLPLPLWLGLYFPDLALEALALGDAAGPVVVFESVVGRRMVHTASAEAMAAGVVVGMTVSSAQALCPGLQVRERDCHAEQACLLRLAEWASQFSSWVSVEPPQAVLLEVRGSLRLFGGLQALQDKVAEALAELPHVVQVAVAPTPSASLLLSRAGGGACVTDVAALRAGLGRLPVDCLPLSAKLLSRCKKAGLRDLRDVWRLPKEGLTKRFGRDLVAYLDRLLGLRAEPREAHRVPAPFSAELDLPSEVSSTRLILLGADQLLQQLTAFLLAQDAGSSRLDLWLYHVDRPATRLLIGTRQASRDAAHWLRLVEEHLNQTRLVAPVIALHLRCAEMQAFVPERATLFADETAEDEQAWCRLLEQLEARLGREAVCGLSVAADHRPEQAWQRVEVGADSASTLTTGRRPLWLLPEPQRLEDISALTDWSSRERIEAGWWDGDDVRRDYFAVTDVHGSRLWVFRDLRDGGWYLHGLFG